MDDEGRILVLVVDDERDILETSLELLAGMRNARLVSAGGGVEAKQIVDQLRPDVVISDYRMPEVDGLEVLRYARQAGAAVTMMVTAFPDLDVAVAAINGGKVAQFFVKPPDPDGFYHAVQAAVDDVFSGMVRDAAFARARAIGLTKARGGMQ